MILRQRTAALEVANNALQEFAYVVSHDLKAPLRGINQLVNWLIKDYADAFDDKGIEMIGLLTSRVGRMDRLNQKINYEGCFLSFGFYSDGKYMKYILDRIEEIE